MFDSSLTRRGAFVALAGLGAGGLAACNAPPQSAALQPHPGALKVRISSVNVDTSAVLAQSGDPTASWLQAALPGLVAQAFGPYMAPGAPNGATLNVRIASITLGDAVGGSALDWIKGSASLSGKTVTLNASTPYIYSPTDDAMWEQTLKSRVQALAQAFAYWLPRKFNL